MVIVRVAQGWAGSTTTGRGAPVAAPPTTAPATPPTTAPTGPPTTAPVTAPPAAPVKAPLSSARAIVPAPRKVAPARARAESFICELPLSMTPPQNGRRDISFHFGRAVLGVSSRRSAEQIPTEHISAQPN